MSDIRFIGIYEDSINNAIDTCYLALETLKFTESEIDHVDDIALDILEEIGTWREITNSIITAYFIATEGIIKDKYPDKETSFFVNGDDSHFYIDNEEVY